MFHSFRWLFRDIRRLQLGRDTEGVAVLEGELPRFGEALLRVGIQVLLTVAVILACVYVISSDAVPPAGGQMAHTGLGVVLGYWFR